MPDSIVSIKNLSFTSYITEAQIRTRIQALAADMKERYDGLQPIFLGVLNGAFIFAADLLRATDFESVISFIKLSSYRGMKSSGKVASVIGLDIDIKGRHVIIVEDIIDTGNTMHSFIPELKALEPASIALASLLVKPEALQHDIPIDYVGFEIPNRFVVGYGLDYDGLGRQLKDIYQLAE
ncbi:MAG: hypoxanthine phosphoribosyltransferase [Cyanothece sp. SIO1E1]|nr:hypoxanthine phosphoribosyltransferase [Cyanothece sp. SIO1E1]